MGMYTEIFINVDLKADTPREVLEVLRCMVDGSDELNPPIMTGLPGRWQLLFGNGSYYTPRTCCARLTFDEIGKHWSLIGKGDIKNYEGEIEAFFEFLKPWCEDRFMGYHRYEEDEEPVLVYASGESTHEGRE